VEGDVLHMVSPYQKRILGGAPSEVVVSGKTAISTRRKEMKKVSSPRVLYYEAQIVLPDELDSFRDVTRRSGVDADYWHAPLLTRDAKCGVEVAALDRPVGKDVCLPVGVFSGPRLVRSPDTVEPASNSIGAVACGRIVARRGRWDRVDQRLREF
jgi:hypothetical protein